MAFIDLGNNDIRPSSVEYSANKNGSGSSSDLILPTGLKGLTSVNLILRSAGTAKVEYSTTPRATIRAGGTTYWHDWPKGDVTATTADAVGPVSALRLTVTSGNWTLEVRGE